VAGKTRGKLANAKLTQNDSAAVSHTRHFAKVSGHTFWPKKSKQDEQNLRWLPAFLKVMYQPRARQKQILSPENSLIPWLFITLISGLRSA